MDRRSIPRFCGSTAMGFVASSSRAFAQGEKASPKESIVGRWTFSLVDTAPIALSWRRG